MSETNAQEPTMEEILASIRRIISEDDQPVATAEAAQPHPPSHIEPEEDDEVLELTQKVELTTGGDLGGPESHEPVDFEPPSETVGDLDVFASAPTPANQTAASSSANTPSAPAASPAASSTPSNSGSFMREPSLVGENAAQAAASRFGALEHTVQLDRGVAMPSGQTMDQVIRDMLNPMLKAWLDEHLEQIVDAKVQAEVERISRRR